MATGADGDDITAADRLIVAGQIGREPRALRSVAVRCPFGMPAVTRQEPVADDGAPFPTAHYLTCPHLVRQIDRLEAAGGVRRHEAALARDPQAQAAQRRADERHATLDDRGFRIAGSGADGRVKCLHAQAAFALAAGDHPLGEQVLREAAPRWCDDAHCMRHLRAGDGSATSNR